MDPVGDRGRILWLDLATGASRVEEPDPELWRTDPGGALLGARLLLSGAPEPPDPLDPSASLVVASSVVAGRRAVALPRVSFVARSPLTGGIGEARLEGPWAVAVGDAGYRAIAIRGRAERPTTLVIEDGVPRLEDATDLWGLDTWATTDRLRARHGGGHVATIGPAGERLVRFASVVADRSFAATRGGIGAVMGSKNLKAVVLVGGSPAPVADPEALDRLTRAYRSRMAGNPVARWQHEPPGFGAWLGGVRMDGYHAVENYRTSRLADRSRLSATAFARRLAWTDGGCPGCPNDCIKGFDGPGVGAGDGAAGLHQETACALGPNLGINDAESTLALNELAMRLGLDPVSLGFTVAFAMECRDRGLLAPADLDGLDLRFGAAAAVTELTRRIARREGAGEWLADGVRRASQRLPPAASGLAMQVKGLELAVFEPRTNTNLALGYAIAPVGPRYDIVEHDWDYDDRDPAWPHTLDLSRTLGVRRPFPMASLAPDKVRTFRPLYELWSGLDALGICLFASAPTRPLSLEDVAALVRAVTGWETSSYEIMRWGARRNHLLRIYNLRHGLGAADDRLPDRFFDEPIDSGPFAGLALEREAFGAAVRQVYGALGWDDDGVPTAATVYDHDLGWTLSAERA